MGMADGYAQASGNIAVVNLHVAPGLGNAMGMLYDAQKAGSPILVTAGQHEQRFNFTEPLLWADLPTIARPFVKWAAEVRQLSDLPRAIHRAVKTALAPPMGPVFLSLPGDVLTDSAELDLGAPSRVAHRIRGDASSIADAAAIIARAENPLILAGDAVRKAMRWRNSSRWPRRSAPRSTTREWRAERCSRRRMRCIVDRSCDCRRRSAICSRSTTCWCRSAPTCLLFRCPGTSSSCPRVFRSFISTLTHGNWRRTTPRRWRSWAIPRSLCPSSPRPCAGPAPAMTRRRR